MPPSAAAIAATARGDAVREDVERELRRRLRRALELLDARRLAGEPEQAGLRLERVLDLLDAELPGAQEVQHDLGVDRARARRHRHAFERAEAHRRVDRAAVAHGVTEQPPPRWQTTSRGTRTCSAAHCTESPWKP